MAAADHQPTPDEIKRGQEQQRQDQQQNRKNVTPSKTTKKGK